jgi:hypothetical protein
MRYFDAHMHLPAASDDGFNLYLKTIQNPNFIGGCLVLNFREELIYINKNFHLLLRIHYQ